MQFISDSQRRAVFYNLNSSVRFSRDVDVGVCKFAKKSEEDDIPEEYYGDPSSLSDKKYNELLKKKIAINYNKKRFYPVEPVVMDADEYKRAVARGMFGVDEIRKNPTTVVLPSGNEVRVQYNIMGSPVVVDKEFHKVSMPIPMLKRATLKPIEICEEQYCPVGLYHGVGKRDGYNVDIFMDTNTFPSDPNREGSTNIKDIRKFLANSKYLDKFPTLGGVESVKDVEPMKNSSMTIGEVKGAVGKYVSDIPVTKKWGLHKDELKESRLDKKIKEAIGEAIEEKAIEKIDESVEKPLREFTVEYKEVVPEGKIIKDQSEIINQKDEVPKDETVNIPMMESPWEVSLPNPEYAYLVV